MLKIDETSIGDMFFRTVAKRGSAPFMGRRRGPNDWPTETYDQVAAKVRHMGLGLLSLGVKPGDRVALFSPNRPEWGISDLGVLCIGAADAPIYATNSAEEARYIIEDSGAEICLAADGDQFNRVRSVLDDIPGLKYLVTFGELPADAKDDKRLLSIEQVYELGKAYEKPEEFDERLKAVKIEDLATLIYTSGTTGPPKGVMLTHRNFLANVHQAFDSHPDIFGSGDISLSFLPLSHSLERTAGWYLMVFVGGTIYYARDAKLVVEDMKEVRPQFFISVPRLFEKIYAGIKDKVSKASGTKQFMFNWSIKVGSEALPYTCFRKQPPLFLGWKLAIARKLVLRKLAVALGADRIKVLVSGGGPLAKEINEFFHTVGMVVHEGYGLTETTPVATVNSFDKLRFGSVGAPVDETEVRIAEDGEIMLRGPQIMKGYWGKPEATAEVLDSDGWFATGDIGVFEDGYLYITDRKKDLIITAGGKNIAPQNIENALVLDPFVDKVATIGDRRPFLSALLVPAFEKLEEWARERNLPANDRAKLITHPDVLALYQGILDKFNKTVARVEQIKKFRLMDHEFSQETGELTPTMKLKRKVVAQRYADVIESMYQS